jgi:glutamate dehydrogenase (NADP+)
LDLLKIRLGWVWESVKKKWDIYSDNTSALTQSPAPVDATFCQEISTRYDALNALCDCTAWGISRLVSSLLAHAQAPGYGVAHYANEMLQDKNDSLEGKRCLIVGGGKVARSLAEKLLKFGAIPLTFSDASGHVYEPNGFNEGSMRTINKIKDERGALVGRYIISSTTAQFNHPENLLDIPCDLCFPCGAMKDIDEAAVDKLADNGCKAVIEGGHSAVTPGARKILKKRGLMYGPHNLTLTGSAIVHSLGVNATDEMLAENVARIYKDVKDTASEFNARGDLFTGANILGFMRVANVMMTQGAV